MRESLASRIAGGLWGLAVGNVLGLEAEGLRRSEARELYGASGELRRLPREEAGRAWDDDLALAAELGEWAVTGERPDPHRLLGRYLAWASSNGRGIGVQTRTVLDLARSHPSAPPGWAAREHWENRVVLKLRPPQGNGSVMRAAVLGLALSGRPKEVAELAALDASLTHADLLCRDASILTALLAAALVRGEEDPLWAAEQEAPLHLDVRKAIRRMPIQQAERQRVDGPDWGHCLVPLRLATAVLGSGLSFEAALPWVLRQGGDTDTNAAVAGALLGARDGLEAIPVAWRDCVSGPDRLDALADGLLETALISLSNPEDP